MPKRPSKNDILAIVKNCPDEPPRLADMKLGVGDIPWPEGFDPEKNPMRPGPGFQQYYMWASGVFVLEGYFSVSGIYHIEKQGNEKVLTNRPRAIKPDKARSVYIQLEEVISRYFEGKPETKEWAKELFDDAYEIVSENTIRAVVKAIRSTTEIPEGAALDHAKKMVRKGQFQRDLRKNYRAAAPELFKPMSEAQRRAVELYDRVFAVFRDYLRIKKDDALWYTALFLTGAKIEFKPTKSAYETIKTNIRRYGERIGYTV